MESSSSGSLTFSSTVRHSNRTGAWNTIPYSRPMRAACAGLPLTSTVPVVGAVRSPMSRRSVLLPHPDGPMRLTNSPRPMVRSIPESAVVTALPPASNCLSSAETRTTGASDSVIGPSSGHFGNGAAAAQGNQLRQADEAEEDDAEHGARDDGGPQLLRSADVLVVEVDDRPAQPVADLSGALAHDRSHDAGGGAHLQRREEVGQGSRHAQLPEDAAPAGGIRAHQLERPRVGGAKAADHGDGDREEGQIGGDDDDAQQVGTEGEDDHRCQRHDQIGR